MKIIGNGLKKFIVLIEDENGLFNMEDFKCSMLCDADSLDIYGFRCDDKQEVLDKLSDINFIENNLNLLPKNLTKRYIVAEY